MLLLEEDHYVVEDFLHVLELMIEEKFKSKYNPDILSLGMTKNPKPGIFWLVKKDISTIFSFLVQKGVFKMHFRPF